MCVHTRSLTILDRYTDDYRQVNDINDAAMSTPFDWYMHSLAIADVYVVVCSVGAHAVFTGAHASRRAGDRHWPDMFAPMCAHVLQVRCTLA